MEQRDIIVEKYEEEENKLEEILDEEVDSNKLMAYDIAVFYNTYNLIFFEKEKHSTYRDND